MTVSDDAPIDIEECHRIIPRVLGHQVLNDNIGDGTIARLTNLRPSPGGGQAPALVLSQYGDVGEPHVADAAPETFLAQLIMSKFFHKL